MSRDTNSAEGIGIQALSFIATDPELLNRFLSITGIEPGQIRQVARESGFLAGVLDFILAHEATLLAFTDAAELDPASISKARAKLPHGSDMYDESI